MHAHSKNVHVYIYIEKAVYMHKTVCIHLIVYMHMTVYTYATRKNTCTWLYIYMTVYKHMDVYTHDTWHHTYTHMWVLLWLASAYPNGPLHTFTKEQLRKIFNNTLVLTADPVRGNSFGVGLCSHISKSTKVVLTHSQDGFQLTVPYACFYNRTHWWHACCLLSKTQPVDTYDLEMFRMWLVLTENAYKHNRFSRQ